VYSNKNLFFDKEYYKIVLIKEMFDNKQIKFLF